MARFVLTAQLQLQAPTNTRQVVGEIRNQLAGQAIRVPVEVQGARQAQTAVQDVTNEVRQATSAADALGRSFGLAIKRFAAFTVASRAVSLFTNSLAGAVDEAIQFQREVIKIAQVTGASDNTLKGLTKTITDLSTGLGVVSSDLLAVTRILSQAGVRGRDLEVALESLAKSTLAPTFDDITQTAEGAVAILAQFQKGTGALESQLGSINAVAGAFAVESGDLIGAVRRFGGVFKSAGGSLEELLAIFTSVRQTTRESAESISTGLRTIFTRIQRPETIRFLKQLGVELQDAEGRFVGPIEAVEKLGKKFADLEQGDLQFIRIAEELGGFRQIGKVIPLIQQYEVSLEALKVAQDGQGSLADDTAKAQEALAVQITKVKQDFLALVRSIAESTSFQLFTRTALELASALIKIADAVKPLLPLLGGLAAIKFTRGLGGFFAGAGASIRGLQGRNAGGKILGFARGGFVPGTGNRDTVPAMLQPGEFVIKKSSAQKLGAETLEAMNNNKFNEGTPDGGVPQPKKSSKKGFKATINKQNPLVFAPTPNKIGIFFMNPSGKQDSTGTSNDFPFTLNLSKAKATNALKLRNAIAPDAKGNELPAVLKGGSYSIFYPSLKETKNSLGDEIRPKVAEGLGDTVGSIVEDLKARGIVDIPPAIDGDDSALDFAKKQISTDKGALNTTAGYIFEGIITALTGAKAGTAQANFDFSTSEIRNNRKSLAAFFGQGALIQNLAKADAKATYDPKYLKASNSGSIPKKTVNDINAGNLSGVQLLKKGQRAGPGSVKKVKKAAGGSISGPDTVPALLTPGEFVVNKKAAQSIGYGNLNTMNKKGVAKFAQGGAVGIQRFQGGGAVGTAAGLGVIATGAAFAQSALSELGDTSADASDSVAAWSIVLERGLGAIVGLTAVGFAVKATLDWTKSLRESIKAQDEAKAAAQAAKEGKTDGTTDKQRRQAERDAKLSPRQREANKQRREKVAVKKNAASLQKQFEEEDARRADLETVQVPDQAKKRAEAEAKARQAEQNKRNVATRDQSAFARDRASQKLAGAEEARDFKVLEQEERSRRISALETQRGVLTERQARGQAPGKIADPDRAGVNLSKKDIDKEIAQLSTEYQQQAVAVDKVEQEVQRLTNEYVQQDDANKKATKSLKDQGKAGLTAAQAQKNKTNADAQATKAIDKEKRVKEQLRASTFKSERLTKKLVGVNARLSSIRARENKFVARASKQLKAFNIQLLRTAANSKRSAKGLANRGFAKVAGPAAGALGAVAAIAVVGQQIAQGFQQWFKRAEEIARKNDDIAGAIEAAGNASLAGSVGEAFTLTGFAEIAADSIDGAFGTNIGGGNGKQSFVERSFQKRETAEFEAAKSFISPRLQAQLDTLDPTLGASQEDRDNAARGTIEAFARTRSELSDLAPAQRDKALLAFNKQARDAIKSLDGAGVSIDELRSTAINLTGTDRKLRESLLKQVAAIEQSRKVQAELNKANLQSLQITSAFGAANAAVANFAAGLETGSSTLGGYINTLQQAQSGVGIDASAAIDAIEKDLVDSATAAGADVLADDVRGQANVARASTGFAAAAGGAVENLRLSANNPEAARAKLEERLRQAIPQGTSREVKEQIGNVISKNVQALGNDLSQVDLSDVVTKISQDSQALAKGFFEAAKLQDQHNQAITKLYQQREQIEAKVAESLNKAIDVQLEAAKNFESFGGARLTGDQQLSARIAQFNNVGGLAGVGLRTGDAQDIQRVAAEIGNVFNNSQQTFVNDIVARSTRGGGPGVFAGPEGFQKDQRPEAQRSNDQLLKFTRQRIQLLREELKIVKAKNQEEKNALDKLISGDIEGFIKGQAAAGAGAALRSGSSGLTSLFSASALGAGFKSLEGQGLTEAQKGRAEQLTLERFGLQSQGILSGTTAEERELNAQGRELSQIEGQLGAQAAQFAKSEIAVNEATIIATKLTFQNELQNVANRNANFVAPPPPQTNRWMGGPIYANRGMFVPRGTDTVPAMLTPGEFVVNRSAVQRGNNLQILRAMNSQGGASSPNAKSGGGRVYYNTGGVVEGISSAFQDSLPALRNVFDGFSQAVDRLANTQFSVKLDTTNVNVNLNGASFLATMKEDIKRELLDEVSREIGKAKPNSNGDMELRNTVL